MRLFVALELPPEVQDNFASLIGELRPLLPELRWTPAKNIHLTLKFLGETKPDLLDPIRNSLEKVQQEKAMSLRAVGIGSFHGRERGAVLFARIAESTELTHLAAEIHSQLESSGISLESRSFTPHLTLARSKDRNFPVNMKDILVRFGKQEFAHFQSGKFHLFESKLKPTGAEYTILQSFSFVTEPRN